jgi:hypothetical protein
VAQENTSISSPDFKKKDKTETKSLNMIGPRFKVSMQQEPGFAARPYLKTRSFRWRALLHVGRHISSTIWPLRVAYYLLGRGVAEQTGISAFVVIVGSKISRNHCAKEPVPQNCA